MFNNDRFFEESNGQKYTGFNQSKRLLYDRWKKPATTDISPLGESPQMDSRFRKMPLSAFEEFNDQLYIPARMDEKTNFFTNARIHAQGQNLLTFTKFSGLDPEAFTNMYQAISHVPPILVRFGTWF